MIWAKYVEGWNMSISMLFGKSPKFTIQCGNCDHFYHDRVAIVDHPTSVCKSCGTVNKLPIVFD